MRIRTLTVTELTGYLKRILLNDPILNNLVIKGEISNFKLHNSGHAYFSIKDEGSKLKCVMFSKEFKNIDFLPQDGMKVVVKGYISIYDRNGEYQLYVKELKEEGLGDLHIAFERLKKELEAKGYFEIENKKELPAFPKKIGVVTSPTGAAIRDIVSVITRRNNYVDIIISSVLVQGDKAAPQIAEAIEKLNHIKDLDLIIISRGGGSIEELWPFNEEIVAMSIFNSKKPVISAVGHETDFTISDFVADLRAPTPSAAGEIAAPQIKDIESTLDFLYKNIKANILKLIEYHKNILINYSEDRMKRYVSYKIKEEQQSIDYLYTQMINSVNKKVDTLKESLSYLGDNLNNLSPLSTISRGYAIAIDEKKSRAITTIKNVKKDDRVKVLLKDGHMNCIVESTKKGENTLE